MSQLLRFPTLENCKVSAGPPLGAGEERAVHTSPPAATVNDIPPKSKVMQRAELPCQKVIDTRRKKEEAQARKAAAGGGISKKRKPTGAGGSSRANKKKTVEHVSEPEHSSNHVSSPDPLHTAEPLQTLCGGPQTAEKEAERLANLHHQEDEFDLGNDQGIRPEGENPAHQGAPTNALVISIPSHTTFPSGLAYVKLTF